MYNMTDILAQLQGGQSADAIAQAFTDALNAAIQEQTKQSEAAATRADKINRLGDILEEILMFVEDFYPGVIPEDAEIEITDEDVGMLIDELDEAVPQLIELATALADLEAIMSKKSEPKIQPVGETKITIKKPVTFAASNVDFGDAIGQFFKQNGLM